MPLCPMPLFEVRPHYYLFTIQEITHYVIDIELIVTFQYSNNFMEQLIKGKFQRDKSGYYEYYKLIIVYTESTE